MDKVIVVASAAFLIVALTFGIMSWTSGRAGPPDYESYGINNPHQSVVKEIGQ
jgi:hypothetical protein